MQQVSPGLKRRAGNVQQKTHKCVFSCSYFFSFAQQRFICIKPHSPFSALSVRACSRHKCFLIKSKHQCCKNEGGKKGGEKNPAKTPGRQSRRSSGRQSRLRMNFICGIARCCSGLIPSTQCGREAAATRRGGSRDFSFRIHVPGTR